ncbi:MAG TPA: AAA family ATPase [Candidatus Hydrogenedens sp.]|nr:AAA family ATPase [Candidatus Hydrogenedens sp.]HOK09615.1 AAA family ATPase [Candidatus Hydrogenedens sp.]HOL20254.1 AAA family ATPase [Candidatus Hydrogenedens sp.]
MLQKWAKEIIRFLSVKNQFVLHGNIYDIYPFPLTTEGETKVVTLTLSNFIANLLKQEEQYSIFLNYEPLFGFKLIEGETSLIKEITGVDICKDKFYNATLSNGYEIIEKIVTNDRHPSAIILNFSSRFAEVIGEQAHLNGFYYKMFRLCLNTFPKLMGSNYPRYNLIFWILEKENDIPSWFTIENPKLKTISIPKPDNEVRNQIINSIVGEDDQFKNLDGNKQKDIIGVFVDQTSKMQGTEIISIVSLARREKLTLAEIGEAIRRYKIGVIENPWAKIELSKIEQMEQLIENRVKGQKRAVKKAVDIVRRSFYNLSGAQFSRYSQKPKGILFLAGPTGVGKTELAKTIAEVIFGSETAYIRFDMSEFGHEHSDQRLLGAPPGYVGYDVGGELTNSIKQNPFTVVLFDEIEKAHPKILDIFLQILDDGRLTSGRGETVYFSEALIVFTSNLGVYDIGPGGEKIQRINPDMEYEKVEKSILEAIGDFFKFRISRPEILNRIGENIAVFDFIRPRGAELIFRKMFENVLFKLEDTHKIIPVINEETIEKIKTIVCSDLSMGGRGIGNKIEEVFINPLSQSLIRIKPEPGMKIEILDIVENQDEWVLKIQ